MKEGREGAEKSVQRGKCLTESTVGKRRLGGENWRVVRGDGWGKSYRGGAGMWGDEHFG